jgi:hypothetical protein
VRCLTRLMLDASISTLQLRRLNYPPRWRTPYQTHMSRIDTPSDIFTCHTKHLEPCTGSFSIRLLFNFDPAVCKPAGRVVCSSKQIQKISQFTKPSFISESTGSIQEYSGIPSLLSFTFPLLESTSRSRPGKLC